MKLVQRKERRVSIRIRTALKAGYRPVHGLVAPDGTKRWVSGWFDLDSMGQVSGTLNAPPPGK